MRALKNNVHQIKKERGEKIKTVLAQELTGLDAGLLSDILGVIDFQGHNAYIIQAREGHSGHLMGFNKYKLDANPEPSRLRGFISNFYAGKLKQYLKSARPPMYDSGNL